MQGAGAPHRNARLIMTAQHRIASSFASPSRLRSPSGGRLATGDAATLGMMVFYNWREKQLAKTDPEGYARLQRLKAVFRAGEPEAPHEKKPGKSSSRPLRREPVDHQNAGFRITH
jgi:hypothetical protein